MEVENIENVEEVEAAAEEISREEGRGSLLLWFAVLGSPLAWGGHLVGNYSLEEWFACSSSAQDPGRVLGLGVNTFSLLFNTAMLAVAVASGLVALRCWRRARVATDGERLERARWMAFAGVVEACLFVGIIVLGYLPALTLDTCRFTP
ncbi:MAG: hypothetical protein M3203_13210 [Actinomycetota bacterium]|nr:hypothetical protein [Actinomycetota bacterium]